DQAVALEPVSVTTQALEITGWDGDTVTLTLTCSAGFYVRSLAQDLGDALGTGAHLAGLRRTRSGDFGLAEAVPLDVVDRDPERAAGAVIPLAAMLPRLAAVTLTEQGERHLSHGRDLGPDDLVTVPAATAASTRLIDRRGELVGIAERSAIAGFLHPSIVLM